MSKKIGKKQIKFKRLVFIETPYSGQVRRNLEYARACVRDCLERGESPFSSALLYSQDEIIHYRNVSERPLEIEAGAVWARNVRAVHIIYGDLGVSKEMHKSAYRAMQEGRRVEYRDLGEDWNKKSKKS